MKPGPVELLRRALERVLHGSDLGDGEYGDDDDVRRVGAHDRTGRATTGSLTALHLALERGRVRRRARNRGTWSRKLPFDRLGRLPDAGERDDCRRRAERRDDVGELDRDVVRRRELKDRESRAADDRDGPRLAQAPLSVDDG